MVRCNHLYRLEYRIRPIYNNNNYFLFSFIFSRQVLLLTSIPFVRKYLSENGVCLMMQVVLALYLCPNLSTWMASRKHVITIVMD